MMNEKATIILIVSETFHNTNDYKELADKDKKYRIFEGKWEELEQQDLEEIVVFDKNNCKIFMIKEGFKWVKNGKLSLPEDSQPPYYIFWHSSENTRELVKKIKENKSTEIYEIGYTTGDRTWKEIIKKYIINPILENKEIEEIEKIRDVFIKKNLIKLIHRIAHLFLPLDIDLMGICEVLKEERENDAEAYFNEAFSDSNHNPGEKIEKLLKRITDKEDADNIFKEEKFKDLPDDLKNIIKTILTQKFKIKINEKEEEMNIDDIKNRLDKNEFKSCEKIFKDWARNPEENPFHQWFCKVMEEFEKFKANYTAN